MKIKVDAEKCEGHSRCYSLAPELVDVDDLGNAFELNGGEVPAGLPSLSFPSLDWSLWQSLASSALLISIVGFVESISVAQTLAAKRRQRVDPDQELLGLGAANLGSALSGGFPVTGGFSRSVVNFDAGAVTPAAGSGSGSGCRRHGSRQALEVREHQAGGAPGGGHWA